MNQIISKLKDWGCDIAGSMDRFLQDESFYLDCAQMLVHDENFEGLGIALQTRDKQTAFDHAHALKGVIANLGLSPLLVILNKIVEPLRHGEINDLLPYYEQLMAEKKRFAMILSSAT